MSNDPYRTKEQERKELLAERLLDLAVGEVEKLYPEEFKQAIVDVAGTYYPDIFCSEQLYTIGYNDPDVVFEATDKVLSELVDDMYWES